MFNRISAKLRNSTPSRKKHLLAPSPVSKPAPADPPPTWAETEDEESLDSYSASHAESLFPIEDDHRHEDRRPANPSLNDELSSFSFSDENENEMGSAHSFPTSYSLPEEGINVGPAVLPDYDQAEEEFLEEFEDYFENLSVDNVRKEQYSNLDVRRIVHLDYASNPLFSRCQVEEHLQFLIDEAPCSAYISESNSRLRSHVSEIQDRLLGLFNTNADGYTVFFTTGLSGSFKLVGEAFPFDRATRLVVSQDSDEQARHLVSAAAKASSRTTVVPLTNSDFRIKDEEFTKLINRLSSRLTVQGGLVVLPAQSGLSGNFHRLQWIQQVQSHAGWHVVVDVTMSLPAGRTLDLSAHRPEFVVGSLEHALGYPPGIGFMLVKRNISHLVVKKLRRKKQVAGVYIACEEDGLINTSTLVAVATGLDQLERVGVDRIQKRVSCLGSWLRAQLEKMRHVDEDEKKARAMIKVYGSERDSSILVFNLVDSTGHLFPARIVQKLAEKQNVKVGVCGFSSYPFLRGGGPFGEFMAVRLSLGCMSNFQDAYRFVQFLTRFRDEEYMSLEAMGYIESSK